MIELNNIKDDLIQNLKDTNCDSDLISKFSQCCQENNEKTQIRLLQRHRSSLLERLHAAQKDLDRLDYFIYEMRRAAK